VDYSFIKYGTDVFKQSTSFGALNWKGVWEHCDFA